MRPRRPWRSWCRGLVPAAWLWLAGCAAGRAEPGGEGPAEGALRWRALPDAGTGRPGFVQLSPATTRVLFTNRVDERAGAANRVLYNGAGVAAGDVDGDGRPDLLLLDLAGANALFRNQGGWVFEDITAAAGLAQPIPGSRGAVFADADGDRDLDLLLAVSGGGVRFFRNDGRGKFTEATAEAGTGSGRGASTLAVADVNGDGTPDLYVAHYSTEDVRDRGRVNLRMVGGRPVLPGSRPDRFLMVDGSMVETGEPDQLYLNNGAGRFRPVSWTGGAFRDAEGRPLASAPLDWGLTATFRDLNGDGAPDLYVCNDYWTPDRCWINDGRGGFRALPAEALRQTPGSSMGVDVADVDRDGTPDLFVVDMLSRHPRLRKRQGLAQAL
ncbi:MAG: FG-GAP repeat domain-containing protein, partial [Verrucomicrobiota bacterium]